LAREAILFDRVFHADTPEGRLIANEVAPASEIDRTLARCVENAIGSGVVSPGANRKAIRQQTEPLEAFRRYLTTYAFEQAFCHLSDQLIVNLEKHWNARQRKL
jgi:thioesterase DpgC